MMLTASPVVRVAPASAALRAPRRAGAASRSRAGTVCAAKPVESMTLKDGRKVNVYASTADATTAVADAFVAAYNEARCSCSGCAKQGLRISATALLFRRTRDADPPARRAGCAQEGQHHHRHPVWCATSSAAAPRAARHYPRLRVSSPPTPAALLLRACSTARHGC
jgi:hypothetical protein